MKHLFSIMCLSILLFSCKSKPGTITIKDDNGKETKLDISKMAEKAEESKDKAEELKKLKPLSLDELKAFIPEEFMGMKRSRFNANSFAGASTCTATYKPEEGDKELKVNIFDCAGEAGAGIFQLQYMGMINFQSEDDNGYQKSIDFNGSKAVEKYSKGNEEYGLTYIAGERFLVSVEGEKMSLDEVKQAAKELKVK